VAHGKKGNGLGPMSGKNYISCRVEAHPCIARPHMEEVERPEGWRFIFSSRVRQYSIVSCPVTLALKSLIPYSLIIPNQWLLRIAGDGKAAVAAGAQATARNWGESDQAPSQSVGEIKSEKITGNFRLKILLNRAGRLYFFLFPI
jgi:hypothetical protein